MGRRKHAGRAANERDKTRQSITATALTHACGGLQKTQTTADYLRISGIRWLPLGFCTYFSDLRILNLKGCALIQLPYNFDMLQQLQYLDVSGNPNLALPASLLKCTKLQRLICSPALLETPSSWHLPWIDLEKTVPRLGTLCCKSILLECDIDDLDWLNVHLRQEALMTPLHELKRCYECNTLGHLPASRTRIATVALRRVPLHFSVCSSRCLHQLQATMRLEDALNEEKRTLRLTKFGPGGFSAR
ncbi:hypothetical protein BCR37DRAFT_247485 [Protomyces lactucae-debilis]|uniref:Uncharacterized protein n=1 Tax=Protomyces lactucae-debilis TaxID=2754530 RepID=A0A1Y2FNV9_PROLT|nr:uncharacterized protein BCR37DRAFT_247485 [Protomyces lactucae-debilis]ORY85692.1 hypothetical protein BCR37DRAFT_247485 [Protomyces lactucae-debilis]